MSFSVKGEHEDYAPCGAPRGLFCQPRNLVRPRFQRMIVDPCASSGRSADCSSSTPPTNRCSRRIENVQLLLAKPHFR